MQSEDDSLHSWRLLGRKLADLRKSAGYTQQGLTSRVPYGRSSIGNIEIGRQRADRGFWVRCDAALATGGLLTADYDRIVAAQHDKRLQASRSANLTQLTDEFSSWDHADTGRLADGVRLRVESALGRSDVAPATLDEWEAVIAEHARATRYRPARLMYAELLADTDEVQQLLHRRHTASGLRRATRITAQMAGLLSLTILKLNDFSAARQWGRTARIAAAECGDPAIHSWVWAQEAHRYFYADDPVNAIAAAERAQERAGLGGGVGAVLAAALEARARAAVGDAAGTRLALGRAEDLLTNLGPEQMSASALGYDEAQLRFHAGNAYTHLRDGASARAAHDRALQLYPEANYLDRTLVHLDRAACLIHDGDIRAGSVHVEHILSRLPADQHDRLVVTRAEAVLSQIPAVESSSPAVRDAHDYLATLISDSTELPQ